MTLYKPSAYILTAAFAFLVSGVAVANPLVFQGQNAAIFPGANPSDTAAMMNSVPKPAPNVVSQTAASTASLILAAVQSQISSKIYNDIFGTNAKAAGSEVLGGGNFISWKPDPNNPGNPQVTITYANGTSALVYGSTR